ELLGLELGTFEDRELGLVRVPLAFADLDPLLTSPGHDHGAQLGFAQVEAPGAVGKLAQLDMEHGSKARRWAARARRRFSAACGAAPRRRPWRCAARWWDGPHPGRRTTWAGPGRRGWWWRAGGRGSAQLRDRAWRGAPTSRPRPPRGDRRRSTVAVGAAAGPRTPTAPRARTPDARARRHRGSAARRARRRGSGREAASRRACGGGGGRAGPA